MDTKIIKWLLGDADKFNSVRSVLSNYYWLSSEYIIRGIVGFVAGFWVARYLGPTYWGELNYAITFVSLFYPICTLGMDRVLINQIVIEPSKKESLINSAITIRIFATVISFVLIMLFSNFSGIHKSIQYIIWILSLTNLFSISSVFELGFQAEQMSKYSVQIKNASLLFSAMSKVLLILFQAPLIFFALLILLESILIGIGLKSIYHSKTGHKINLIRSDKEIMIYLVNSSKYIFLSLFAYYLYTRIDQIFISYYLGNYQLGIYNSVSKICEIPILMVQPFLLAVFPFLSKLYQTNREEYFKLYKRVTIIFTLFSYTVVLLTIPLSNKIINLLYGSQYTDAGNILKLQIFVVIVLLNSALRSGFLTISSNQKIILITALIGVVVNLVSNVVLIPIIGLYGASLSNLLTNICVLLALNKSFKETKILYHIQKEAILLGLWKTK